MRIGFLAIPLLIAANASAASPKELPTPGELQKSVTETVRILLEEEHVQARHSLVIEYFANLPTKEIPEAFKALLRFEQEQTPRLISAILGPWAARDPVAAWEATRLLIDIAVKGDRFVDSWEQKIIGPKDRHALKQYPYWIESSDLLGFYWEFEKARITASERARLRQEFEKAYGERFGSDDFNTPLPFEWTEDAVEVSVEPSRFAQVLEMLTADLDRMPSLISAADQQENHGAFVWGLRRWIREDPSSVPVALDLVSKSEFRDADIIIVKTWAKRDAKAALAWFRKHRPEALLNYAGMSLIAYLGPEERSLLLRGGYSKKDKDWDNEPLYTAWAEVDPQTALQTALRRRGREFYSICADAALSAQELRRHQRRKLLQVIRSISVPIDEVCAVGIMEELGAYDVVAAAQYGVEWFRQVRASPPRDRDPIEYDKDRLIRVWSGKEDPYDGCMDDRTYGCLRVWAFFDPDEMRRWVKNQQDPEIRRALLWLVDHPNGAEPPSEQ
jgi:hypothetical protein